MAPRRGEEHDSHISGHCTSAFRPKEWFGRLYISYFVGYCLFFLLCLVILISLCYIRRGTTKLKELLAATVFFQSLYWGLSIIGAIPRECGTVYTDNLTSISIAAIIFYYFANYFKMVTTVWGVNILLSTQLQAMDGLVNAVTFPILGIMGVLHVALAGLTSYNIYYHAWKDPNVTAQAGFDVAYTVLYMVIVLASGKLSATLISKLQSKNIHIDGIKKGVAVLFGCMLMWSIFEIIVPARTLNHNIEVDPLAAIFFMAAFFESFSFVAVAALIRLEAWNDVRSHVAHPPAYYNDNPPEYVLLELHDAHHNTNGSKA